MKLFYDHLLIDLHKHYAEIEHLEIDVKDKRELIKLLDETTHHTVFDVILQHLHPKHHQAFLEQVRTAPSSEKHWQFLTQEIADIETKILQAVRELSARLQASIGSANRSDKLNKANT